MSARRGESAVVVPVRSVEATVARWPDGLGVSAAQGVPAHITIVYPFLCEERPTGDVLAQLGAIVGEFDSFEVTFERTGRFPRILFLAPEPVETLRRLTLALAERWPDAPPYAGAHEQVVPHLTVASADEGGLDEVEPALRRQLPLTAWLDAAVVYVFDGGRWRAIRQFRLCPEDADRQTPLTKT